MTTSSETGPLDRLGDRYDLLEVLGKGGSAVLYRAFDSRLQRTVAVKRMRDQDWSDGARERFAAEGRVLASLRHPHLVDVYDAGEDEQGLPYLVMELLDGQTLEDRLGAGPVTPDEVLGWAFPLLGALACAHDEGVLHRDIKPSNIFLRRGGHGGPAPVLIDFGIAKRPMEEGLTTHGVVLGTPAYMSPEQATDQPLTVSSDLWSLGVVLYRLLSGRLPFEGGSARALLVQIARDAPIPLATAAAHVPVALATGVDAALRPAGQRPRDARAYARLLLNAAVAAGLEVPPVQDLALPDWNRWLAEADGGGATRPLAAVPVPDVSRDDYDAPDEPTPKVRHIRPLVAVAVFAGLAAIAGAGVIAARTDRESTTSTTELLESHSSTTSDAVGDVRDAGVLPAPAAGGVVLPSRGVAAADAAHSTPAAINVDPAAPLTPDTEPRMPETTRVAPQAQSSLPRRRPRAPAGETTRMVSAPEPSSPEPATPQVVSTWDL